MVGRSGAIAVALALGLFACSSSSSSGNTPGHDSGGNDMGDAGPGEEGPGGDDGGASGPGLDGGLSASDGSSTSKSDASKGDAGGQTSGDGATSVGTDAGGGIAAGDTGVAQFCTQACNRAQTCAAMVDGGSVNVTTCMTNCTTTNDEGPPNGGDVVLYRSDYVVALTACVAAADCADTLGDKAADNCQTSLASSFAPSAAVVTLCQHLEASTCMQDMTPECLTAFLPYSDATIQAITTCIADPTCTNHDACVAQALTP
jgi:hypothetical protein